MQNHDLIWTQAEGFYCLTFPITEFNFKGITVGKNINNSPNLTLAQSIFW